MRSGSGIDTLRELAGHSETERRDLSRVRSLLDSGDPWDRSTPLHLTGSALVVHRPTRRVLLRWHERQGAWLQVGGHGDPGEHDPLSVALREALEETGLTDLAPSPDFVGPVHVVCVPVPARDPEPAHEHADVRYVLTTDQPDDATPEREDAPLRWLTFDEARAATSADNLRETLDRIEAVLSSSPAS